MAKFLFFCFLLGNLLMGQTMASDKPQALVLQSSSSPSSSNPQAEPPTIRKLGKHNSVSPSMAPQSEKILDSGAEGERGIPGHHTTSVEAERKGEALGSHDSHHSVDKSIAGGGVILGGLATTFMVAVFCYIRATTRHNAETTA